MVSPRVFVALCLATFFIASNAYCTEDELLRRVHKIEWQGVESVSVEDLEAAILTTKASWKPWDELRPFDPGTLEQDLQRIRRYYRRKGFYESEIRSELIERDRQSVVVRIFVEEGRPVPLEEFILSLTSPGNANSPLEQTPLREDLPLPLGSPFSPEAYEQGKQALLQRLAKLGYPAAKIAGQAEVNLESRTASIDWKVDPGPYVRLGNATPFGLDRVDADLVLGEVAWKPGDPYDPDLLRKSQRAIFELGLFSSVTIQPVPPPVIPGAIRAREEQWPLEIRVQERSPRSVRVAVGYGTEDQFRVKLGWKHRNFFGGLRSLRIGGKYSFLERGVEAVFTQPRFLDRKTQLTLDIVYSQETEPAFDTQGVSTGWLLERPLFEKWEGRVGQRFELRRVTQIEADEEILGLDDDEAFRLVFFDVGMRRSNLDSTLDPTRGSWLDFSVEPAFRGMGSQVNYIKALAEARLFFPLPIGLVLATRARAGIVEPFDGDTASDLPIFKRFFSGGSTSVRGFALDTLGPLDSDNDPLGGLTLAEASAELRFPIWRALGGVFFFDAGQVALDSFELRKRDFYFSGGAGLRVKTPIGPLRLDFAQILNPPSGIQDYRIHFSVGQAF